MDPFYLLEVPTIDGRVVGLNAQQIESIEDVPEVRATKDNELSKDIPAHLSVVMHSGNTYLLRMRLQDFVMKLEKPYGLIRRLTGG